MNLLNTTLNMSLKMCLDTDQIRIATKDGEGWYIANVTKKEFIESEDFIKLKFANVYAFYKSEKREGSKYCCELNEAFCFIIEGKLNGRY